MTLLERIERDEGFARATVRAAGDGFAEACPQDYKVERACKSDRSYDGFGVGGAAPPDADGREDRYGLLVPLFACVDDEDLLQKLAGAGRQLGRRLRAWIDREAALLEEGQTLLYVVNWPVTVMLSMDRNSLKVSQRGTVLRLTPGQRADFLRREGAPAQTLPARETKASEART